MTTTNQWISFEEIEQTVAHRVANAIESITIYETKTRMASKSISHTKEKGDKALGRGETDQDLDNMEDDVNA
ncbi:hypothetical protein Tco_1165984 [Tanacetum coccineum]